MYIGWQMCIAECRCPRRTEVTDLLELGIRVLWPKLETSARALHVLKLLNHLPSPRILELNITFQSIVTFGNIYV